MAFEGSDFRRGAEIRLLDALQTMLFQRRGFILPKEYTTLVTKELDELDAFMEKLGTSSSDSFSNTTLSLSRLQADMKVKGERASSETNHLEACSAILRYTGCDILKDELDSRRPAPGSIPVQTGPASTSLVFHKYDYSYPLPEVHYHRYG